MNADSQFTSSFYSVLDPRSWDGAAHIQGWFSTSVDPSFLETLDMPKVFLLGDFKFYLVGKQEYYIHETAMIESGLLYRERGRDTDMHTIHIYLCCGEMYLEALLELVLCCLDCQSEQKQYVPHRVFLFVCVYVCVCMKHVCRYMCGDPYVLLQHA